MKLLFCHDGPIEKYNNEYYGLGFNDELFERYKIIADSICVAMRVHQNENSNFDLKRYLKLSSSYSVIECPNLSSIKGQLLHKKLCFDILDKNIKSVDLVIIRLPSFIGNVAVDVCKKNKKRYYVELVGCPFDSLWNFSFVGKFVAPFMFLKTRSCVKKADFVLYVSDKFLQNRYPTYGKSIGCSDVKLLDFKNRKSYDNINDLNNIVIGTIGVLDVAYKGQKYVIRAIELLKNDGINVKYELVGSGNGQGLIDYARKHNVSDNVYVVGQMKHDEIFDWLKHVDIYIQPSTTEGMPRALIEAMSTGCFCIASNAGGMPELIDKQYIFKKKNYKQIYKIIKSIHNSDLEKQSKLNYERAHDFSYELLDEKRNNFLKEYKEEIVNEFK